MRVVGICTSNAGTVGRFLDSMLGTLELRERRRFRKLVFPAANPVVGALVAEDSRPPVQCASRPDGSFAILDGEIYNATELPANGAAPDGNDAERVLALYASGGQEAIARIDAAASITIWDATGWLLLAFRDRWGIVPAYYVERPDGLFWASHIGPLLRMDPRRQINLAAVDFFLGNGFVPAPWTLVEHINKIPPAHVALKKAGSAVNLRRYWRPTARPKLKLSAGETTERLAHLFKRSLRRRWRSDQKSAVLLSGGVDSKLVVGGLRNWFHVRPDAFTFHYDGYSGRFNEGDAARRAACHFDVPQRDVTFRPIDIVDRLEWMLRSYGEPFSYGLHSSLLRDVVDTGAMAVFSGAGAGYLYPRGREIAGRRYAHLPPALQALGPRGVALLRWLNARTRPVRLWRLYAAAGEFADEAEAVIWCGRTGLPASFGGMILPDQFRSPCYREPGWVPAARRAANELFRSALKEFDDETELDRITFLDFQYRAAEGTLHWNHWWARAHGLAIRLPYLDAELLDFAMQLPRKSTDKEDLRRLAASLMPHEMAYAPKTSQTIPIGRWFRGPLKEFLRDQLAPARLEANGLFDVKVVQRLVREHLRGDFTHEWKLWGILSVVAWDEFVLRQHP